MAAGPRPAARHLVMPAHGFAHVEPAAQVCIPPPLHLIVQAASSPQVTVQLAAPVQSAVHPPLGQSIAHVLFPVHVTVDPVSTPTLHVLPPPHVTVLSIPVETVQLLVPSQVVVQLDRQLPSHVDLPAHDVVQPVPQVELQLSLEEQW
jgi:hypothetical protein